MARAQADKLKDRPGIRPSSAATDVERASGDLIDHDLAPTLPKGVLRRRERPEDMGEQEVAFAELSAGDAGGRRTRGSYGGLHGILEAATTGAHGSTLVEQPPLRQRPAHQAPARQRALRQPAIRPPAKGSSEEQGGYS